MAFEKEKYIPRIIDKKIKNYLEVFGAISIEGPKWCGKTWTSSNHAKSSVFLDDKNTKEMALLDLNLILNDDKPELIDEWHLVPEIWDAVRRKCDDTTENGNYILTCSTQLNDEKNKKVFHSGAGRIGKIKMYPMSLYESGDSTGEASLSAMLDGTQENKKVNEIEILELANLIVRGGWPRNINTSSELADLIPKSYIESILDKDINNDKKRDRNKMLMLLRSLARNESTVVSNQTLIKDIEEFENNDQLLESRNTLADYLDVLDRLSIIENQEAYSINYRSPERIGKSPKKHLTDPSLSCALLNLTSQKLISDLNTFGFMFESLVERDLRIYIESLGGNLYHFRDNVSGLEVDSIVEFPGGDYGAIEIKLGSNKIDEAKKSLLTFYENMKVKPNFMCIIVGKYPAIVKDPETGIYIVPINTLKP